MILMPLCQMCFADFIHFFKVQRVLKLLENPYSDNIELDLKSKREAETVEASCSATEHFNYYDRKPPSWAIDLRIT